MSGQTPQAPAKPPYLGELIRRLREAAGLTRSQFEKETGVSALVLRRLELNRDLPTAGTIRRLLPHPSMADLPARAKAAGLSLGLGDNGAGKP